MVSLSMALSMWFFYLSLYEVEGVIWKVLLFLLHVLFFLVSCSCEDDMLKRIKKLEDRRNDRT